MIILGESISDAIDWTQDRFATTRPLAEQTLFSMLHQNLVEETEEGFVLIEAEEEAEKHFTKVKNQLSKNKSRFKFHSKRKNIHQENTKKKQSRQKHLDNSSAAEGMQAADDDLEVPPVSGR